MSGLSMEGWGGRGDGPPGVMILLLTTHHRLQAHPSV